MALIDLQDVHLKFQVQDVRRLSLKEYLVRGLFMRGGNPSVEVHALKDITIRLNDGDRLGVIGHNGAGKSTLLKMMAGIYPPTSGLRHVVGQISSLFEIALGFEMDSNGWDNIRYRGYLQGETPRSLANKIKSIAEYSELGRFLDIPVRYYSAGMMIRLAFSIASAIEPEILLIDEVLGAGDMAFQNKVNQRMSELMKQARVMVVISHEMGAVLKMCNKAIWMDHGRIVASGKPDEVVEQYRSYMQNPAPLAQAA